MVATHGDSVSKTCHLSTEAGIIGGNPVGGLLFGAARNATALLPAELLGLSCLQNIDTGEILMQAFADRDAVNETLQTR